MAKRNSHPDYKANKAAMCRAYNRLLSMVSSEIRETIPRKYMNRIGLDTDLHPVTMSFTGATKRVSWNNLCTHFRPMIIGNLPCPVTEDHLKLDIVENLTPEKAMQFVEICEGDEIYDAFLNCRPGSCMSGHNDLIQVYANNPEKVDVIVFDNCGLMDGKPASWLRWKGEKTNEFDKAYFYANSRVFSQIKETLEIPLGVKPGVKPQSSFTLKWVGCHKMPYMDTFVGCEDFDCHSETITISKHDETYGEMSDTSGFDPENNGCQCEECGMRYNPSNEGGYAPDYDMSICDDCCGYCEYSQETVPASVIDYHSVYLNGRERNMYISERALRDDFTESEYSHIMVHDDELIELSNGDVCSPSDEDHYVQDENGECHHIDDAVMLNNGEWCKDDEAIEVDGEWYRPDDGEVVKTPEGWKLECDCVEIDGEWYHTDSELIELVDDEWCLTANLAVA